MPIALSTEHLPITIMTFCGFAPKDTIKLRKDAISDGMMDTKRAKTSEPVWLPLTEPVLSALEKAPKHNADTVCANNLGKSWPVNGFNASWQKLN